MAKIAVITRTKDRAVFLGRALDSVASQSYGDYEHLIINDGGDNAAVDNAVAQVAEQYRSKISVVHRDVASGGPDTIFTESVDRSSSDYVVIHDDDDTWHKDFLKQTTSYLDEHNNIGGVVVRTEKILENTTENGTIKFVKSSQYMPDLKVVNLYRQCIDNQLTPIAFVYRRKAYEEVGKYDSTLPVCGDWEFGIRFLQKYDVDFIDPGYPLANYHHRVVQKTSFDTTFANHDHRYYTNIVMNRYLRKELSEGRLGLGYIMNQLRYSQTSLSQFAKRLLPKPLVGLLKNRFTK